MVNIDAQSYAAYAEVVSVNSLSLRADILAITETLIERRLEAK